MQIKHHHPLVSLGALMLVVIPIASMVVAFDIARCFDACTGESQHLRLFGLLLASYGIVLALVYLLVRERARPEEYREHVTWLDVLCYANWFVLAPVYILSAPLFPLLGISIASVMVQHFTAAP